MSFSRFKNDEELKDEVHHKLGHPIVKVELDKTHWDIIVKNAKRWFFAKKSLIAVAYRDYSSYEGPILFSDIDPVNGVYKVLDIIPDAPANGMGGDSCTYYELLPNGFPLWGKQSSWMAQTPYAQTSFMFQIMQSVETRRRVYGSDLDWFFQYDYINGHVIYLTPQTRSRRVAIIYKPEILPIQALVGRDAQLIYEYTLAEAKELLGTIRSKYKDYPAAGGTISTDGPELLEQAKTEKERLEEEISGSQGPMGVIFG